MTVPPEPATPVPDLLLEQYLLGELDAAATRRLDREIAASPALAARLDRLRRSDQELRADRLPDRLAHAVVARAIDVPRQWPPRAAAAAMAVATVAVVVVALPWLRGAGAPPGAATASVGDDRIKGTGAALAIYRQTPGGSELLHDGDRARPGDVLRVGYQAARGGYGAIVSIDGRGAVTRHYPLDGTTAAPLEAGTLVLLAEAFELDDAPRWERFHLFSSPDRFELDPVMRALGTPGGDAPPRLDHVTISLVKEPTP
ncbi:MAG: anti-sigma factor [Vicinamibacterales bacterium]